MANLAENGSVIDIDEDESENFVAEDDDYDCYSDMQSYVHQSTYSKPDQLYHYSAKPTKRSKSNSWTKSCCYLYNCRKFQG